MKSKYHIDVTAEENRLFEDQSVPQQSRLQPKLNSKALWAIIICAHIGIVGAVVGVPTMSTNSTKTPTSNTEQIKTAEPPAIVAPIPTPAPVAVSGNVTVPVPTTKPTPQSNLVRKLDHSAKKSLSVARISTYTVKPNDTLYSIVRKYKLNLYKLIKLNDIKHPDKLVPGQTLKFL